MNTEPSAGETVDALRVAVVIPMYEARETIETVVTNIPAFVHHIVVVDDRSPDDSLAIVREIDDPRLDIVCHEKNQGVGGAMATGYRRALELGADVMVKMDADDQMDPDLLPAILAPVSNGEADYAKGNRFIHATALGDMPRVRRIGNIGLSFLTKLASGYWGIFDPTNGYTAIHRSVFDHIDVTAFDRDYFFESGMLAQLGLAGAVVQDVYIPARYAGEKSNLSEGAQLLSFPPRLLRCFLRRIWVKHFVRDFGLFSLYLLTGFALGTFGACFGLYHWFYYSSVLDQAAPVGTIMLSVLPIILGGQLLLQAVALDVQSAPTEPLQMQTRQPRGLAPARTVDIPRAARTAPEARERTPEPKA